MELKEAHVQIWAGRITGLMTGLVVESLLSILGAV